MNQALEKRRDELAEKSASTYQRIMTDSHHRSRHRNFQEGYINGFNACAEILLPLIKNDKEAFEYYIKNCEPLMYEYVGEFPQGGYMPFPIEWTVAQDALSKIESFLNPTQEQEK